MAGVSVSDRRRTAELSRVLQHYCVDAASQRCRSTANILLVETPQSETEGVHGFLEIVRADNFVIDHNLGDVISQSSCATEETFPSKATILGLPSAFFNARRRHVTVLASSGDQGATEDNSGIVDITKGNNSFTFCASSCGKPQEVDSTVVGFPATRGFDLASGWGTINSARFVPALAGKGEDEGG